ncbi:hypothetical protein F4823DRAFT_118954 [Ustulina deusta]|nr:hypothetical protein F4823DRAFT_118954 [Ustulina deusta]
MSSTLLPFLYQTRTILRVPATHRASARIVRLVHGASRSAEATIPFDHEIGPPVRDTVTDGGQVANRGTITPMERLVFERIFADIEARGLKPTFEDDIAPAPDSTPNRSARLIMQQAAYDAGQSSPDTVVAPSILSGAARDRAKARLRLPAQLRGATDKVLDTIKRQAFDARRSHEATYDAHVANAEKDGFIGAAWKAPAHSFSRALELEARRNPERTRIEGFITSATSDFALWDVLEKEVFTMPARLGIVKSTIETPKKRGRKATKPTDESENDAEPYLWTSEGENASPSSDDVSSPDGAQKISLYVHGPLYPAYLLLALRRLNTAFSAPSPLVFSILPRIKELGLESYVLGVSTPFFNELLAISWTRRGDLSGMLDLIEEMRHCGLYFDRQTASILNQVDTAVSGLANVESRSEFGKALMRMPEYEPSQRKRIRHWHREVDLSTRERREDFGFVETSGGGR